MLERKFQKAFCRTSLKAKFQIYSNRKVSFRIYLSLWNQDFKHASFENVNRPEWNAKRNLSSGQKGINRFTTNHERDIPWHNCCSYNSSTKYPAKLNINHRRANTLVHCISYKPCYILRNILVIATFLTLLRSNTHFWSVLTVPEV